MTSNSQSLQSALLSLRATPPRIIQSPPTQPRRASVALVLRLNPPPGLEIPEHQFGVGFDLDTFFKLPWVNHPQTRPQLLFIRRTTRPSDRYSSHIAFPGGRSEASDPSSHYTALRETWEEIGIDLAEREYAYVGRLDDREITTSLGKRLLMILSPFVFIQTTPVSPPPDLQPEEISSLHWIDLDKLSPPVDDSDWGRVEIDISSRLSPRNRFIRVLLRGLVGGMTFISLLLPDEPCTVSPSYAPSPDEYLRDGSGTVLSKRTGKRSLRLWGLTLGMTLDLLSHLPREDDSPIVRPRSLSGVDLAGEMMQAHSGSIYGTGPKTPVTVTSTFDDEFKGNGRRAQDIENSQKKHSLSSISEKQEVLSVGSQVDLKVISGAMEEKVKMIQVEGTSRVDVRMGKRRGVGPGITAVFPRFSYPDVNMFIWLFSRRYRKLLRQWEESTRGPPSASSRRVNWSGAALSAFYSAVRQALVVAIIFRALAATVGLAAAGWWLSKWLS